MLEALAARGYATAGTDDGHQSASSLDATWALGHPDKVADYGWRALKETTDAARALIQAYADAGPRYAYFEGCSDGGREALMEAQRFPDVFNGIVAGAPAADATGLNAIFALSTQTFAAQGAWLAPHKLRLLESAVLASCSNGESYISDPASCRFDPETLACRSGEDAGRCLTPAQVAAVRSIYRGVVASDGRLVSPGYTPGGEAEPFPLGEAASGLPNWSAWLAGPSFERRSAALATMFASGYGDLLQIPNFDLFKFDPASTSEAISQLARVINATDPDLSAFRDHGGKLIQFHGWNDAAIPARMSIAYSENVRRKTPKAGGFYRLYMVPGMLHCGGGRGPQAVDWLKLVETWVERGSPPGPVEADQQRGRWFDAPSSARGGDQTQVLCPYPDHAVGVGNRAHCAGPASA
jgi:tannase/feruloyl esterase